MKSVKRGLLLGGVCSTLAAMQNLETSAPLIRSLQKNFDKTVIAKKRESELEGLSQGLQSLIENYVEAEKQKEAEKALLAAPEPVCDFHFQHHVITQEQIAGGLPSEVTNLIALLKNPARFKELGLQELPAGALLHGPSGTGKTMLAKIIACQTSRLMVHEYSSSFITSLQGSGVERIRRLFEEARKRNVPVILFIDEIDGLANNELKGSEGEATRAVHELHRQLDMADPQIFVIMATNAYEKIPPSIKDRFAHTTLCIGLPDFAQRLTLFKHFCRRAHIQINDDFLSKLALETEGLSCRVLENIVMNALICAGQRAAQSAVAENDFYIAAYTTQKMKLPNAMRRLQLIKHYLREKRLALDIDDAFIDVCVQEADGWDAQRIETWVNLTFGLALAKGRQEIERVHALIAFSLVDSQRVPHKIRRKLLFSHFLAHEQVEDLQRCLDSLIEESEGLSTHALQKLVELAIDIRLQKKQNQLTGEHLFTACVLLSNQPLTYDKRVMLLNYYVDAIHDFASASISKDFLRTLVLQMPEATLEQVKGVAIKAREVAHARGSRAFEPEDFYVAVCLSQRTMPLCVREYRIALVNYFLRYRLKNDISPNFFQELIDILHGLNCQQVETVIKETENWAHKRKAQKIQQVDVTLALYQICFAQVGERMSFRETILSFLLEGKGQASIACLQKLVRSTHGFPLDRLLRIFDYARESSNGTLTEADLYVGLFLELQQDEKEISYVNGWYKITDKIPNGDRLLLPDESQRRALLAFYLKRRYHKVSDAFKDYFVERAIGASRHGILAIIELAMVRARAATYRGPGEVHIEEFDMRKATEEIYPFIGFWPWRIESFGRMRSDFHQGFNIKT